MSKAHPHIAIVEQEFLIAVDAQYLIGEALECRATIIRPDELERWATTDLPAFDFCLLDLPIEATPALAVASRLQTLGIPFAFTSVSELNRHGVTAFDDVPVIAKPYGDGVLLSVVGRMLPDARLRQN